MKALRWIVVLASLSMAAFGQETAEGPNFQKFPVPENYAIKSGAQLPARVDNSKAKYFPSVINQYGWSCNQASSIGYLLTYEMCRVRNADAGLPENQHPPLYPWNFLKYSSVTTGVSYFDSWEIIKAGGCPNYVDFPYNTTGINWMSGYDKYYRAMQNRVLDNYSMSVGTAEGLEVLKRYLLDHYEGTATGGLANFQIGSSGIHMSKLPNNSKDAGASIITSFGTEVGHAMTIVGYDDSIKLDLNVDGQFTNTIDINNDGLIDLNDYEKGALIVYNSWGDYWGDRGKAYVHYSVLGKYASEGGFWNRSVHVAKVARSYQPTLTMRVLMRHSSRNQIRIMAGVSADIDTGTPEHVLEFPMFNFQGGDIPLFNDYLEDTTLFEIGLDISPLLTYLEKDHLARIFLVIDEQDLPGSGRANGSIEEFTVCNFFGSVDSVFCPFLPVEIANAGRTLLSVVHNVRFNQIEVTPVPVQYVKPGDYVSVKMEATGAANPYKWELVYDFVDTYHDVVFPEVEGKTIMTANFGNFNSEVDLPFDFPFYDDFYNQAYINKDGAIVFDLESRDYPYVIDPDLVLRSRKKIIPYGGSFDFFRSEDGIRYSATDSLVKIFWEGMVPTIDGGKPTAMACYFYEDGTLEFFYKDPEYIFSNGSPVHLGLSNGDNRLYRPLNITGYDENSAFNMIRLRPYQLPHDTKLESAGWLFCRPDRPNHLYDVHVRVRDKYNQTATGVVYLSTRDLDSVGIFSQNYPNPFSQETQFQIEVPESGPVLLDIFDTSGRKIRSLIHQDMISGPYTVPWNSADDNGRKVPSGVYFSRLIVGERMEVIKLVKQ